MPPERFERLLRQQLAERDKTRRARLGDAVAYQAADQELVNVIMEAAGYGEPGEEGERPVRKARRGRAANEAAAFGEDAP